MGFRQVLAWPAAFLPTGWISPERVMFSRRYTVLIADRSTGVVRRITISLRAVALVVGSALMMPVLIGLGARWSASLEMHQLRATNTARSAENGNYRETTG